MQSTLDSTTSSLSVIVYLNFFTAHATELPAEYLLLQQRRPRSCDEYRSSNFVRQPLSWLGVTQGQTAQRHRQLPLRPAPVRLGEQRRVRGDVFQPVQVEGNPSRRFDFDLRVCRASRSTVLITRSGAIFRALRHRPSVPSGPRPVPHPVPRP